MRAPTSATRPHPRAGARGGTRGNLLERLSAVLSEAESRRTFAEALASMEPRILKSLARRLGPDTGQALLRAMGGAGRRRAAPGKAKVKQEWDRAWSDWDDRICEAADKDGRYVLQERPWEQPCFDPLAVTADLEPIAERLEKLLPRVFNEDLDPDFSFADAVKGSVEDIASSLPEWMGPFESEAFWLGPKATRCLLDWEWRGARRQGLGAFEFADSLRELEASTDGLRLDEGCVAEFMRRLPARARKALLDGIQAARREEPWSEALSSPRSNWLRILRELRRGAGRP